MTKPSPFTLVENKELDDRANAIATYLFGYRPPKNLALPQIDWDLFKIPDGLQRPNFNGVVCGEGLVGLHDDKAKFIYDEVAHLDETSGFSTGPVGFAFANALTDHDHGFNNLLDIINPNLMVKPLKALITKIKTDSRERANQMFGPVQSGIAEATVDCLENGLYLPEHYDTLVTTVGVFVDPKVGAKRAADGKLERDDEGRLVMVTGDEAAEVAHRLYCFNYLAHVAATWFIQTGGRSPKNLVEQKKAVGGHVLRGFKPKA